MPMTLPDVVQPGPAPTVEEARAALVQAVETVLGEAKRPLWIFLSGGVDSTLLLALVRERARVCTVTVANRPDHPDAEAATCIAQGWGVDHVLCIPTARRIALARGVVGKRSNYQKGDEAVYLACWTAYRGGARTILATDGIDELAGGYWWHANESPRFPSQRAAFEHFWSLLERDHLRPLRANAEWFGLRVECPYLGEPLLSCLARVPLEERAGGGRTKVFWREVARPWVPDWVIGRDKVGFCDALEWGGGGEQTC